MNIDIFNGSLHSGLIFDFYNALSHVLFLLVQAVNTRLLELNGTYKIFNERDGQQLCETARQLREKQILISFVGHLNVGKSTLLNALLGARLVIVWRDMYSVYTND